MKTHLILFCCLWATLQAQTLHFIPVFAKNDPLLGASAKLTYDKWLAEAQKISEMTDLRLKTSSYNCSGSTFGKMELNTVLDNLDVASDDVILFYYFGHGYRGDNQAAGDDFPNILLVQSGEDISQQNYNNYAHSATYLANKLHNKGARLTICIIEGCNNLPGLNAPVYREGKDLVFQNLTGLKTASYKKLFRQSCGTVIIASASPGQKAVIPKKGEMSFFGTYLWKHYATAIEAGNPSWESIFAATTTDTKTAVGNVGETQVPKNKWIQANSNCGGDNPCSADSDGDGYNDCVDKCKYEKGTAPDGCRHDLPEFVDMVQVQGGTFQMGSNDGDSDEKPVHSVTLRGYYIGRTEVTQKQWREIMGTSPSYFKNCDDCPVEQVSWDDIQEFLRKLNQKFPGKNYRLPTEEEWEFAARGGNNSNGYKYAGSNSDGSVAWNSSNAENNTHPVGQKNGNELGIYDMSGNVWEWCEDIYSAYNTTKSGSYRVIRGGGWGGDASGCRVAYRCSISPDGRDSFIGFRLGRTN